MPDRRQTLTTLFAGLAWMVLALVPIMLLKSQIVEIRTLYVPMAGLALSLAALFGWVIASLGRWRKVAIRAALLITGAGIFVSSLAMAGLVRTYQLRWDLDQKQLSALRSAIPNLPKSNPLWLLPVALDERSVSLHVGREALLDQYLFGVFETSWSARDAIRLEYGEQDVHVVTANRWDRLRFTSVQHLEDGRVSAVTVQEKTIPVDHLLTFTYRQGRVIVLNPLVLESPDGSSSTSVHLPLAVQVRSKWLGERAVKLKLERS